MVEPSQPATEGLSVQGLEVTCAAAPDHTDVRSQALAEEDALGAPATAWLSAWPDGLVLADHQCRVTFMSSKAKECVGWFAEEAMGRHLHELFCARGRDIAHGIDVCPLHEHTPDPTQVHSAYWLTRQGVNVSVDFRVICISVCGQMQRLVSFYDNRERSHSYREMAKLTEYVERSPTPVAEFDAEGQLLFGNPALQEELLQHGFDDSGTARIWPANLAALCALVWEEQRVLNDVEVAVGDGWYRWHFHPVVSQQSVSGGSSVLGYLFNITEQKLAHIRLTEEKAAARRDFYAKMVHELRTPLNAIIGFSQVLMRRAAPVLGEREMASLRAIRAAGLQLNELVSDTLDISKIEAGKMDLNWENFVMADVFQSFQDQVTTLADAKQLEYQVICEKDLVVRSDFRKVRQILLNLIGNAIKYTEQGSIAVRNFVSADDRWLVAEICDTGVGIPPEQLSRLFRPYEQVTEGRGKGIQGTGLGLALVAELVQMLGGHIDVESTLGTGSLFRVRLPREQPL